MGVRPSYIPANKFALALYDKVMGILLSAFSAAQGSPFWFYILKKIVNIRGSGKNPDEKPK